MTEPNELPQPAQVVAAAGSAIVTAARVGRVLTRSGWRMARQLPWAATIEREAHRLQTEAHRNGDPGGAPLRSAMSELLERSVEATRADSRKYLYETILIQLVPDEARMLAALADGSRFAACDVVQKLRRGGPRVLLANASAIGRQAGLLAPDNVPTYVARLCNFGLVEFAPEDPLLDVQYDILATDAAVQHAREAVESGRRGSVKLVRKTLAMSTFGREFWAASDPSRPALPSG